MNAASLWNQACQAGFDAGLACIPVPMTVTEADPITGQPRGKQWVVDDGPCGFAWVTIRPARGPLVSYLKAQGIGRNGYGGGWRVSIHEWNQSITRKEAHAHALAEVLRAAGVDAYADSRLD